MHRYTHVHTYVHKYTHPQYTHVHTYTYVYTAHTTHIHTHTPKRERVIENKRISEMKREENIGEDREGRHLRMQRERELVVELRAVVAA